MSTGIVGVDIDPSDPIEVEATWLPSISVPGDQDPTLLLGDPE
jgi:hypothetical protein